MYTSLPLVTADDILFAKEASLAISLFSNGQTWLNLDSTNLAGFDSTEQYNKASGYMAGCITALLGSRPVTWPVPLLDSAAADTLTHDATTDSSIHQQRESNPGDITSANAITDATFTIYPNPTSGNFTIAASGVGTFTLHTLLGQQVQQYRVAAGQSELMLPSQLAAGIYTGIFIPADGSAPQKVKLVYVP